MPVFESQIAIEAAPARVWDVLTDFGGYAEWNPLFTSAHGSLANGSRVRMVIKPPFGLRMKLRGRVMRVDPERELVIRAGTMVPGFYRCEFGFRIASEGDSTRLHHREIYGGALIPIVAGADGAGMRQGCFALNLAIKRRAENQDWRVWPRARG